MLSVDKFQYPRKQTRSNEYITCLNDVCHIVKRFRSIKILAILFIWPQSSYKHSGTRSHRMARKLDDGRYRHCDVINDVPFSFYLMLITSNVKYVSIPQGCKQIRSENQHQAWDKHKYYMIILVEEYMQTLGWAQSSPKCLEDCNFHDIHNNSACIVAWHLCPSACYRCANGFGHVLH